VDDYITSREVVARARRQGLDVSERSLRLYVSRGLVPGPEVRSRPGGGRAGYYQPKVVDLLKAISDLQGKGQTLDQIKEFLDRLQAIALRGGHDPLKFKIETARALDQEGSGPLASGGVGLEDWHLWAALGGPLLAGMVRRGLTPDTSNIAELRLQAISVDGDTISIPLYLALSAVELTAPQGGDADELASLVASYWQETRLAGPAEPFTGEQLRGLVEGSYDLDWENFIAARSTPGDAGILGLVYLGVEPERLRAGQVRLEGPYVRPEYRGQGLGRKLMLKIEARARQLGATYIDAFLGPEAKQSIAFLRHLDYRPEFFVWVLEHRLAGAIDDEGSGNGDGPDQQASRPAPKRARERDLRIVPIESREELAVGLELSRRVNEGRPGYYQPTVEDLEAYRSLSFPLGHAFNAYLKGRHIGTLRHSLGSQRVYVEVLPDLDGTWVEKALWGYMLDYGAAQGLEMVTTEISAYSKGGSDAAKSVGFQEREMRICYRKDLVEQNRTNATVNLTANLRKDKGVTK